MLYIYVIYVCIGLMCYGAPWSTPGTSVSVYMYYVCTYPIHLILLLYVCYKAMYNIIESVRQLTGRAAAAGSTSHTVKNALVYGNGGVLSASAVAILSNCADRF